MSLWDKIITQNRIESELIRDLNDISYRSTGGRSEKGRGFRDGIVNLGQLPFLQDPPKDKITREMIEEYQKSGITIPISDLTTPFAPVYSRFPINIRL